VFYQRNLKKFIVAGFLAAIPLLSLSILADSWFYEKLTFTPWNFLMFNVITGGSDMFGMEPWYYYLFKYNQHYMKNLFIFFYTGFFIYNYKEIKKKNFPELSFVIISYLTVISMIKHKEQ
jgi:GPI mannosyltransferase 3